MTEVPWTIWLVAALMMGGLTLFMALALWLVTRALAGPGGGWNGLQRLYSASGLSTGTCLTGQTVQVGRVVYKNCVGIVLCAEGLYLDAGAFMRFFGRRPLLIPWHRFGAPRPTTLHWQSAVTLPIGLPEIGAITIKQPLYRQLVPFLSSQVIEGEIVEVA